MDNKIKEGFKDERAIITPYSTRLFQASNDITKGLYVTHTGFYPNATNHYRDRKEGASQFVLIYCAKGKGWIKNGGKTHNLKENCFFIIPANDSHVYGADDLNPWSIYWIHFTGENTSMFSNIFGRLIQIDDSDNSRIEDRIGLFNEIYQNLEMGYSSENLEYVSICLLHLLASLKYVRQYRSINKNPKDDVIQNCITYMRNNIHKKITLQLIADHVYYSSNHINLMFKENTSYTLLEYFNQLKIQRACSLLQFTNSSIKEIAFTLNFYDQYHFSKAFKKEMEITPREYRKRYNELSS